MKINLVDALEVDENQISCCYVLYRKDKPTYIGETSKLGTRLKNHRTFLRRTGGLDRKPIKEAYNEVDWTVKVFPCRKEIRDIEELKLTIKLNPKLSKSGKGQSSVWGYVISGEYVPNLKLFCKKNKH